MTTLKTTYKDLAIPYFKEVFQVADEVLTKHDIPYYLIGASAIALELLKQGVKPLRGTKDIDFAIMVSSEEEYDSILSSFEEKGFGKVEAPWTIRHPELNVVVDLLPFGTIEDNFTVNFPKKGADLHVLGFSEVLEETLQVEIEENIANIPSLHGMVILKLVSWSDRPEKRGNDPYDILKIIEHYFDLFDEEIYEDHNDLFDENEFNQLQISARVLGRKAGSTLNKSEQLEERVLKVLNENIGDPKKSKIAEIWAVNHDYPIEYSIQLLDELKRGILETLNDKSPP